MCDSASCPPACREEQKIILFFFFFFYKAIWKCSPSQTISTIFHDMMGRQSIPTLIRNRTSQNKKVILQLDVLKEIPGKADVSITLKNST